MFLVVNKSYYTRPKQKGSQQVDMFEGPVVYFKKYPTYIFLLPGIQTKNEMRIKVRVDCGLIVLMCLIQSTVPSCLKKKRDKTIHLKATVFTIC